MLNRITKRVRCLFLFVCVSTFAHTDGVTQARLTIDEARQFRLELINFDALNYLTDEMKNDNILVEQLHLASDAQLSRLLQKGQARLNRELRFLDQLNRSLPYSMSFPSLSTFKNQIQVKRSTTDEPAFIIKLHGELFEDSDALFVQFPDALNQVSLKQITIQRLHVTPGQLSVNLLASNSKSDNTFNLLIKYLKLGYVHILPKGLDHILFVLGLFFLACRFKTLVIQITAFTLAHTVTLVLTTMGLITVPATIVEPLIALSIVFIAIENIFTTQLKPWRPAVVFGFGLLHGMGFAGVLTEIGLPDNHFLPSLIAFNIGVEFGQLTVVIIAAILFKKFFDKSWYRNRVSVPASIAIAIVGLHWSLERLWDVF